MAYTLNTRTYGTPGAPLTNVQIDANFQNLYDDIQTRYLTADVVVAATASKAVLRDTDGSINASEGKFTTLTLTGDAAVNGGDLTSSATTFNLLNSTVTSLNIGGASTATAIGSTASGTTTVGYDLTVNQDLQVKGGDITTNQTSFNLLNTTATTISAFGAGTTVGIGAASGTLTLNNPTVVGNASNTSVTLWNTVATTVSAFGAATTLTLGGTSGTTTVRTPTVTLSNATELNLNGASPAIKTSSATASVFNSTVTTLNIGQAATTVSIGATTGTTTVNNALTVTGNLTVNGTTTTTNSTTVTIDDPIFTLGGDTAPTGDDNKDRGIEYRWHTGTVAKVGFFGYSDSLGKFTFIPDATNTSEVFSGTKGTLDANLEWADLLNKPSTATSNNFGIAQIGLDSGFTWATTGSATAASGGDTVKLIAGDGITLNVDAASKAIRITNDDTVDPVTYTQSLTLSTTWQNTGIDSTELQTGSHMVQITVSDSGVGGGQINEIYTGVMSWYSSATNSAVSDEVALHRAGAGPGSGAIFLRILRQSTVDGGAMQLQIIGNTTNSGASNYTFKFRKLI